MPTDLPNRVNPVPNDRQAQAALLTDALGTDDAFLISHVLRGIASSQGQSHAFGDDPALSIVLASIATLGLELTAKPRD